MSDLLEKLPAFLNRINAKLSVRDGMSDHDRLLLRTYLAETRIGLDLISPYLKPDQRVLEIGSGIGALGHFLAENDIDIHALEPSGEGFNTMSRLAHFVSASIGSNSKFLPLDKPCETVSVEADGLFDLIFSVHVIEHMNDLEASFAAMERVLAPGGVMVHLCPNYRFPYDPHFGIYLPFWSRKLAHRLHQKRISDAPDLWNSLNFIGAGQLARLAQQNGLELSYQRGVMTDTFRRLIDDDIFAERHKGLTAKFARTIAKGPFLKLVDWIPPKWASPMIGVFHKPSS